MAFTPWQEDSVSCSFTVVFDNTDTFFLPVPLSLDLSVTINKNLSQFWENTSKEGSVMVPHEPFETDTSCCLSFLSHTVESLTHTWTDFTRPPTTRSEDERVLNVGGMVSLVHNVRSISSRPCVTKNRNVENVMYFVKSISELLCKIDFWTVCTL
jgi:hypothetical protein